MISLFSQQLPSNNIIMSEFYHPRQKQQKFSQSIRKINRKAIFERHRNTQQQNHLHQISHDEILDHRFQHLVFESFSAEIHRNDLFKFFNNARSGDISQQHFGLIGIRKILSELQTFQMVDIQTISLLLPFLTYKQYPQLQFQAIWSISMLVSESEEYCNQIVLKQGIYLILGLLKHPDQRIVSNTIYCVGNLAAFSVKVRNILIKLAAVQLLVYAIESLKSASITQIGLWALSNLCRGTPLPSFDLIKQALPVFVSRFEEINDQQMIVDCCWSIADHLENWKKNQNWLNNVSFSSKLINLLDDQNRFLMNSSLNLIDKVLLYGNQETIHLFLSSEEFLTSITDLLEDEMKDVRKKSFKILSTLGCGDAEQVCFLLERQSLMKKVLNNSKTEDSDIKVQIISFFMNLCGQGEPKILTKFFFISNMIEYLITNLSSTDNRLVKKSLELIFMILCFGKQFQVKGVNAFVMKLMNVGGVPIFEELQRHKDKGIYTLTLRIIENFLQVQDEA